MVDEVKDKIFDFDGVLVVQLFREIDDVFTKYDMGEMQRYWLSMMYSGEKASYVTMKLYNKLNYDKWDIYAKKR